MKTLLTTTLLLFAQFCFGQDFWMQLNLPGDTTLNSLAGNSEGTVFAATRKGVYMSFDNGLNWTNTGITNSAYRIIVDKDDRIFAVIYPNIHYSTNNGNSWSEIICPPVGIVTLHVNNNSIVFGNWGSIYKSSDFGVNWLQTLQLNYSPLVTSFTETPNGKLFAGILSHFGSEWGICRSSDGGDTWDHFGLLNKYISSLAVNSQGTIFAGSRGDHWLGGGGVYRSTDEGKTWQELKNDVLVTAIAITPDDHIYIGCTNEHGHQGGVFRSTDTGETWELINTGITNYHVEMLELTPIGYLYLGARDDWGHPLFRSVEQVFTSSDMHFDGNIDITIYPNPFNDCIHIRSENLIKEGEEIGIRIIDSLGRPVYQGNLSEHESPTIALPFLVRGVYTVTISAKGRRISRRIVKL